MLKKILDHIFVDGVILQRDIPIKLWGEVKPGAKISVKFDHDIYDVTARADGKWEVTLPALPVGCESHKLVVTSGEIVQEVDDILMGDVWVCAGQSNMELPMKRVYRLFADEIKNSHNWHIRQYHLPLTTDFHIEQDVIPESTWITVAPGQTENFSATGFFFAKKLYEKQGIPIGLVMTAIGGTPIEAWMSRTVLADYPEALVQADKCRQVGFMENITASEKMVNDAWYRNLNAFDRGLNEKWYEESFADDDWKEIDLNVPWDEVTDLKASGSIWFRKEVEIPAERIDQPADIILGCIIDADEVYINGDRIGGVEYRYPPRDYPVSNLKVKNTIAIRMIAAHGMGEFVFNKAHKFLFEDGTEISLTKGWKYKRALSCPPLPPMTFFQFKPTGTYNGMIHPLHNYPIKGVIWYQGESNAGSPQGYHKKFSSMILDWRRKWNQGEFPFIFTQLSNWSPKGELMHWELLRDEQTKTLATPNTRMVVTNDIGESNDLHPLNKKAVGERLAAEALSIAYGMDIVSTGPTLISTQKLQNQFILNFETGTSVLTLKHGDVVYGLSVWVDELEIAVEGVINGTTVMIETPYADKVTAISYAWIDDPADANLYNAKGLPAVQFKQEF